MNKDWNKESRELKLRFDERRNAVNREFNARQVQLSFDIDMARNEVYLLSQQTRHDGADIESVKNKLDEAVSNLRALRLKKINLDYERKQAFIDLDRQRNRELDELDRKYGIENEQGV